MKSVLYIALILISFAAPAFASVTVTSPTNGQTVTSPIQYRATAVASCVKGVASMGIYVDNTLMSVVNGSTLSTSISLNPGTYDTVVEEWDNCGTATYTHVPITVINHAGVNVISPLSGSNVTSPVNYVATAASTTCSKGVASMGVYVNNKLIVVQPGAQLNTQLTLAVGKQPTVVEEWDYCGGASFTPINLNVVPAAEWNNTLYVAPNGNDSWSCTLDAPNNKGDGPCATIDHARALVASSLAQPGGNAQNFTVQVRNGTYYLPSTIVFGPNDAAGPGHSVTYEAFPGEAPVISGGVPLTGWTNNGGQWQITLQSVEDGQWNFTQLWANDSRRFRPMLPSNSTYYRIGNPLTSSSFTFQPGNISGSWENLNDVDVTMIGAWTAGTSPISSVSGSTVSLSDWLGSSTGTGDLVWGARYRVENVKEALSQPGQWYLNRPTGVLTYIPEKGEEMGSTTIVAPVLPNLMIFSQGAANITLRGLTFAHTQFLPRHYSSAGDMNGEGDDAAIMGIAASNITIDSCIVRNTGNGGVYFGPGTAHTTIENSIFGDIGSTGISFSAVIGSLSYPSIFGPPDVQGSVAPGGPMSYNTVLNNLVQGVGRVNPAGQGIFLGDTNSNGVVQNNEVADSYQKGITIDGNVGWITWQDTTTFNNLATLNLVYDIGQGVTSDLAGIYTAGVQPGTVISQNIVHDVSSADYGGFGLYADQTTAWVSFQQNVVWNTAQSCFFSHQASNNSLTDNIFENCSQAGEAVEAARAVAPVDGWQQANDGAVLTVGSNDYTYVSLPGPLYNFQRNILAWSSDEQLGNIFPASPQTPMSGMMEQDDNVYWNGGNSASGNGCIGGWSVAVSDFGDCVWNVAGQESYFTRSLTWNEWLALGYDAHSQWVNPNLAGPANLYSTQGSSNLPVGFQDWNHALAGRTSGVGGVLGGNLPFPTPLASFH